MWANYFIIGYRNLVRHRLFSIINLVGLSLGLAAAFAIMVFVRDELNVDGFWQDGDKTYFVTMSEEDGSHASSWMSAKVAPVIDNNLGHMVDQTVRLYYDREVLLANNQPMELLGLGIEPGFFTMLPPKVLHGNIDMAEKDLSSVILTATTAQRLFGRTDTVGEVIPTNDGKSYQVGAVIADVPGRSMLRYDFLKPVDVNGLKTFNGKRFIDQWGYNAFHTLVRANAADMGDSLKAEFTPIFDRLGRRAEDPTAAKVMVDFVPVPDMYLDGPAKGTIEDAGDRSLIISFIVAAVVILAIAAINFMNLMTVRLTMRHREIAVRKIMGAGRRHLIFQFLVEAGMLVAMATIVAVSVVEIGLPFLNEALQHGLSDNSILTKETVALLIGMAVITTLGGAVYPSVFASGSSPAKALAGGRSTSVGMLRMRHTLMILQFSAAISLITVSIIMSAQIRHVTNLDRGFDVEGVYSIPRVGEASVRDRQEALRNSLLALPQVEQVSFSWRGLGESRGSVTGIDEVNGQKIDEIDVTVRWGSAEYLDVMKLGVIAGRGFDASRLADQTDGVVISAATAKAIGFVNPQDAVNAQVGLNTEQPMTVIGVVPDVFVDAAGGGTEPTAYVWDPVMYRTMHVRLSQDTIAAQEAVHNVWKQFAPDLPFQMESANDRIQKRYHSQSVGMVMMYVFAGLAVLISLMGKFGLASFAAQQRAKEIALRKLMGASRGQIIRMMAWQFSKPILVASAIALPVTYLLVQDWLSAFVVRIGLTPIYFVLPIIVSLILALVTVSWNTVQVARTRPAEVFRAE